MADPSRHGSWEEGATLSFVVLGASGDLAKKKTYPALFGLYRRGFLPPRTCIVGYARSAMTDAELRAQLRPFLVKLGKPHDIDSFLALCTYCKGQYDSEADFRSLGRSLKAHEEAMRSRVANRVFYLAVPPSVFVSSSAGLKSQCTSPSGWSRFVIEKPFGRDLASSNELISSLAAILPEKQQFRIDHYLGKEMVQNLLTLRFSNSALAPLFHRNHVASVSVTMKENIGTDGRGGYFDDIGAIRDVIQNHLLQVVSLVAMETPVRMTAECVRDEKVKVLKHIAPARLADSVVGQYTADLDGKKPGYQDDKTVPPGSKCATFAAMVLHIDNERWRGVPFIVSTGKALDERLAEVRVQFKPGPHVPAEEPLRSELVIRIQPDEAVILRAVVKKPGLQLGAELADLDLTYKQKFPALDIPEAYETLLLDVLRGDHSQFVRADELEAAWKIVTPLLHQLEEGIEPESYTYGSPGPASADELAKRYGYVPQPRAPQEAPKIPAKL